MKRGVAVLTILFLTVTGWLVATPSGRQWRLQRTSVADLTLLAVAQPQDTAVAEALTAKLIREAKFEDAATIYAAWATALPTASLPLQKQGEALIRANRFSDAVPILESAFQRDNTNVEALAQLGYAHFLAGERTQAEEKADNALSIQPNSVSANAVKAFVFAERHQFASAKESLQKADATQLNTTLYASAKGYVADKEGDTAAATLAFLEAVRYDENNGQAWTWLAGVQIRTANTPEAFAKASEWLQKAAALLPHASVVPYSYGLLAFKQGDYPAAAVQFQNALNLNPNSTETLYQLSLALELAGRKAEGTSVRKRFEKMSAYQRDINNLQIQIGHDAQNILLWKKMLRMAQANEDRERIQLAQDRISKLSLNP